ncbi:signal peptidase II [Candidatus Contubernalis alkaliaceticus]|uniref:signal peptidase II n=1 Tax=Candidatus Contubernalis alkaliaceticus TaxID=338645 RepID=UPI001F4C4E46|nr:signal peptidase II [Candidatus Contubernalis alkalaceticus]UNC92840.1 signal peptidase II [Candidatus Contubernalis alkalaceticus]
MVLLLLGIGVVFADQVFKYLVESYLYLGQSIPVIPNIFHITLLRNPGAIFGVMPNGRWFFIGITIVSLAVMALLMQEIPRGKNFMRVGLTLIIAGALGNLIDRLRFGYVIDFLDVGFWPVFNIADMALVIGAVFFIYEYLMYSFKKE